MSESHRPVFLGGIYRLDERIGEGAMGTVYRSLDMAHDRHVAIKLMKAEVAHSDRSHRLFQREARAMASLHHPGLVHIHGYGFDQGRPYLVMEWVDGFHLGRLKPLPQQLDVVVGIIDAVLDALAHAHARGIVHRDLKPANILVSGGGQALLGAPLVPGTIKIGDFGIARIFERTAVLDMSREDASTDEGDVPVPRSFAALARQGFSAETRPYEVRAEGTPRYMAPELYKGREGLISPANDIYAVGVLLYELLSGEKPFEADYEMQLIVRKFKGLVEPCPLRPELQVSRAPQELLERMLAPEPFDRIQDCAEVRAALRQWYMEERPDVADVHLPWKGGAPWSRSLTTSVTLEPARTEAEINLLPWRVVPIVGRDIEQVQLWRAFEEVSEERTPQAILIHGGKGLGKTRLASWLTESIEEVGLARELRINLGSLSWEQALRVALEREFHTTSLDDDAFGRRLRRGLQLLASRAGEPDGGPALSWRLQSVASFLRPGVSTSNVEEQAELESLRNAFVRDPDDLDSRRRYATALDRGGHSHEALSHYLGLAHSYRTLQMYPDLGTMSRSILALDPNNAVAQTYLDEARAVAPDLPSAPRHAEALADSTATGSWSSSATMVSRMDHLMAGVSLPGLHTENLGVMTSLLDQMSSHRPVILCLDDVRPLHWEEVAGLLWSIHCMGLSRPLPILLLLTSSEGLPEHNLSPSLATALGQLQSQGVLHTMGLGPLQPGDVQAITDRYRTLSRARRARIHQVTGGNPLFAIELANQMLTDAFHPPDPDDPLAISGDQVERIEDLWLYRVRLLARRSGLGDIALLFLELLCCLDEPFDLDFALKAWQAPEMRLVHRLSSSRVERKGREAWMSWLDGGILVEREAGQVVFTHEQLKSRLRHEVSQVRRASTYHSAAAWACVELGWPANPRQSIELAGHLFGADLPGQAWRYALTAAQRNLELSRYPDAATAYACCEAILLRLQADQDDRRWDVVELGQARVACCLGDLDGARQKAASLCRRGHRTGLSRQLATGEQVLAELALRSSSLSEAEEFFDRALSRYETCSDVRGQAEALLGLAQVAMRSSRLSAARNCLSSVQNRLQTLQNPPDLKGSAVLLFAQLEYRADELVEARRHLQEALSVFERVGASAGVARARCELGYVMNASGDFHGALTAYREALALSEQVGDMTVLIRVRLGLAWTWLQQGVLDEAEAQLRQAQVVLRVFPDVASAHWLDALSVQHLAWRGRWTEACALLESNLDRVSRTNLFDPDLARVYEMLAKTRGFRGQCAAGLWRRLGDETARQWRNLGDLERAHRVAALFA